MIATPVQPGVETQDLYSSLLNQELRLFVKLPWYYHQRDTTYPVLFALDANRSFPLYSTMSLIFETPGVGTQEIVIVGVGYKTGEDRICGLAQWAAWRTRDLTPVRRENVERWWTKRLAALAPGLELNVQSGGAGLFLQSLRDEVIPFVEAHYRVSPADRGLAGYSFGGLFALFALFHAPELFRRYFAGSPSMWDPLFEYEENYAQAHDDLKAKLFVTSGSHEPDVLDRLQRLVDRLRSRGYPGLELLTQVFEGESHQSAYAASVSRALCMLYDESLLAFHDN